VKCKSKRPKLRQATKRPRWRALPGIGFVVTEDGKCMEERAICSTDTTNSLTTAFLGHVEVISFDVGDFSRSKSGVSDVFHSSGVTDDSF